ncbi:MAG: hypothetical protein JWP47_2120 [Polaromonas sp.]|nr:hypothetical protein [Polaromonas sp.]
MPDFLTRQNRSSLSCAAHRCACACVAYASMVGGSIAAAATLVIEDVPVLLLGV